MKKVKLLFWPVVLGIVAGYIITAASPWYMTASNAQNLADEKAQAAVVAALTPTCVAAATADGVKLAEVLAITSTNTRRTAVRDAGWVVYPEGADRTLKGALDQACTTALQS